MSASIMLSTALIQREIPTSGQGDFITLHTLLLATPRNDGLCHSLFVIPHTHVVILSIAKNLAIGEIVSLLSSGSSATLKGSNLVPTREMANGIRISHSPF